MSAKGVLCLCVRSGPSVAQPRSCISSLTPEWYECSRFHRSPLAPPKRTIDEGTCHRSLYWLHVFTPHELYSDKTYQVQFQFVYRLWTWLTDVYSGRICFTTHWQCDPNVFLLQCILDTDASVSSCLQSLAENTVHLPGIWVLKYENDKTL